MKIPKYILGLMHRVKCIRYNKRLSGYIITVAKFSHYETEYKFKREIARFQSWLERQTNYQTMVISQPNVTAHKNMQYAKILLF